MANKGKGSFRSVPFFTVEHDLTGGRLQPTYAMPYQENGARSIDLGRGPRKFSVKCFVAGDDYREDANKLLEAFERPGPGVLIHPVYGRVLVVIAKDQFRLHESTTRLRVVDISFDCTEAFEEGVARPPVLDTAGAVRTSVANGLGVVEDVFTNPRTGLKQPSISDFVQQAHLDVLDGVIDELLTINGAVSAVTSIPTGFASQINRISVEMATLIQTPGLLVASLRGAMETIATSINRVVGADGVERLVTEVEGIGTVFNRTKGMKGSIYSTVEQYALMGAAPEVPDIDTPARQEQRQGQQAIQLMTRSMGLLTLANATLDARYDSARDVREVRDKLSAAMRDLADGSLEPDVQLSVALKDTAAKLIQHLTRIAGQYADIGTFTPPSTIPAEIVAFNLYGDPERADEVILYNRGIVINPTTIPGRAALEVKTF